jgi:hypothetical protein
MLYLNLKFASDDHLHGAGRAQIIVKGYFDDDENDVCLGGKCASYAEVEQDVEFLKRELDQILSKARTKFFRNPQ